jgi:hypothetical protein
MVPELNKNLTVAQISFPENEKTSKRLRVKRAPQTLYIKGRKAYNITRISTADEAKKAITEKSVRTYSSRRIPEEPGIVKRVMKVFA